MTLSQLIDIEPTDREFIRSLYASDNWTPIQFDAEYEENLRRANLVMGPKCLQMENEQ